MLTSNNFSSLYIMVLKGGRKSRHRRTKHKRHHKRKHRRKTKHHRRRHRMRGGSRPGIATKESFWGLF